MMDRLRRAWRALTCQGPSMWEDPQYWREKCAAMEERVSKADALYIAATTEAARLRGDLNEIAKLAARST